MLMSLKGVSVSEKNHKNSPENEVEIFIFLKLQA